MTLGYDVQADRHVGLVWGFAYGVTLDAEGSDRALCAAQGLPHPNLLTD